MLTDCTISLLFEEPPSSSGSSGLHYGFRVSKPKDKSEDWACEDLNIGKEWLIALEKVANKSSSSLIPSSPSAKGSNRRLSTLTDQSQGVVVSCDMFEMHPVFGFTQCRTCSVSKQAHFNPKTLANMSKYKEVIKWPLENKKEGWLYVKKKHSNAIRNLGDWKRR